MHSDAAPLFQKLREVYGPHLARDPLLLRVRPFCLTSVTSHPASLSCLTLPRCGVSPCLTLKSHPTFRRVMGDCDGGRSVRLICTLSLVQFLDKIGLRYYQIAMPSQGLGDFLGSCRICFLIPLSRCAISRLPVEPSPFSLPVSLRISVVPSPFSLPVSLRWVSHSLSYTHTHTLSLSLPTLAHHTNAHVLLFLRPHLPTHHPHLPSYPHPHTYTHPLSSRFIVLQEASCNRYSAARHRRGYGNES